MAMNQFSSETPQLIFCGWNHGFVRVLHREYNPKEHCYLTVETIDGKIVRSRIGDSKIWILWSDGTKDVY
jgi:hypothetical protein